MLSAFKEAAALFERVYTSYPGPEPEAFRAALDATEPMIPAVKEELGDWLGPIGE